MGHREKFQEKDTGKTRVLPRKIDETGGFPGTLYFPGVRWWPWPVSPQENNFQGGVHIVPKGKVKEVAEKMLGKTHLGAFGVWVCGFATAVVFLCVFVCVWWCAFGGLQDVIVKLCLNDFWWLYGVSGWAFYFSNFNIVLHGPPTFSFCCRCRLPFFQCRDAQVLFRCRSFRGSSPSRPEQRESPTTRCSAEEFSKNRFPDQAGVLCGCPKGEKIFDRCKNR